MLSRKFSSVLLALSLSLPLATADFPPPMPVTGNNTFIHDPSLVYHAATSTYFRFSTFGLIQIASSPSLTGPWTYLGHAIDSAGSIINLAGNNVLWAPDVTLVNGTYYMYYAVSVSGSQNSDIGVATSTDLIPGSWTDHGSIGIPKSSAYNKIDPNLLLAPGSGGSDTTPLLTFGSFWRDIHQIELASPPLKIADGAAPRNIEYNSTSRAGPGAGQVPEVMEGAFQFRFTPPGATAPFYYLFWSSGECCSTPPKLPAAGDEYKIMVARASSPTGPWVDDQGRDSLTGNGGTLVLGSHGANVYAPGGQGVMLDQREGAPLVYYHYVDPTVGYGVYDFKYGWNWLDFSSGWPVVVSEAVGNGTNASSGDAGGSAAPQKSVASSSVRTGEASIGPLAVSMVLCVMGLLQT